MATFVVSHSSSRRLGARCSSAVVALLVLLVTTALVVVPADAQEFCFISHGCWGGAGLPAQKAVAAQMGRSAAEHNARFVIAAGDNVYPKGVKSVDDGKFKTVFENVYNAESLRGIPFVTALGNHDYRGNFWAQVNYTAKSTRWFMPYPYFERRFPEASLSVVVLDAPLLERCAANKGKARWKERCWDEERQHEWLDETLAAAARDGVRWRVVVCHYPMYANGPHLNHDWLIRLVEPAMKRHGAQLYLNADNHYLQVSRKDGIYYFNSGGGAGYSPHKRTDKGYRKNEFNTFEVMSMGIGLHCINEGETTLTTTVIDPHGKTLYQFDVTAAPGAKAAAAHAGQKQEHLDDAAHHHAATGYVAGHAAGEAHEHSGSSKKGGSGKDAVAGETAAPHRGAAPSSHDDDDLLLGDHHGGTHDGFPAGDGTAVQDSTPWMPALVLLTLATAGLAYVSLRGRPGRGHHARPGKP